MPSTTNFHWPGFQYDLLPRIFTQFDKHMQIHILRAMVDEYEDVEFNPYSKQSMLRQLVAALKKTCRLQEYEYYLQVLAAVDQSIDLEAELEEVTSRTERTSLLCEDLKELLIQVYYSQDELAVSRDRIMIREILEEYEEDGVAYVKVLSMGSEDPAVYTLDEASAACLLHRQRSHLSDLYTFGRSLFELGHAENAIVFLTKFVTLYQAFSDSLKTNDIAEAAAFKEKNFKNYEEALWGVICCKIIDGDFSQGSVEFLLNHWESNDAEDIAMRKKQRSWLMHWTLFQNLINEREGQTPNDLLEFFLEDKNKSTMLTVCPWLLRYLGFCAVCSNKNLGPKIVECAEKVCVLLEQNLQVYSDPLTEFLRALFVESDFDTAARMLRECRKIFTIDIFLCSSCNLFFNQARLLLFSRYSMVNMRMNIDKIGELLMLGDHQNLPDNHVWSVGNQPVHFEERSLTQWITHTVRALQKEQIRQTSEGEDTGRPHYTIRIDVREGVLLTKPTYTNEFEQVLSNTKDQYFEAKKFADFIR